MANFNNITGCRFGRLVTINPIKMKGKRVHWLCQCDCGNTSKVTTNRLTSGMTKSCGCLRAELSAKRALKRNIRGTKSPNYKHGGSSARLPEYYVWMSMRQRCFDERCESYKNYGGRGITVCSEWGDFAVFLKDMGLRPSGKHTIDRINNDGDYERNNCRWATMVIQANNKRNNRVITNAGETLTLTQWSGRVGISVAAIWYRLDAGWSVEKALTEPVRAC